MATFGDATVNTLIIDLQFSAGNGNETVAYQVPGGRRAKIRIQKIFFTGPLSGGTAIQIGEALVQFYSTFGSAGQQLIQWNWDLLNYGTKTTWNSGGNVIEDLVPSDLKAFDEFWLHSGQQVNIQWNSTDPRPGPGNVKLVAVVEEYAA